MVSMVIHIPNFTILKSPIVKIFWHYLKYYEFGNDIEFIDIIHIPNYYPYTKFEDINISNLNLMTPNHLLLYLVLSLYQIS